MKERAIESLVAVREDCKSHGSAQHELDRRPRPQGRPRASAAVGVTAFAVSGARSILLDVYFLGMGVSCCSRSCGRLAKVRVQRHVGLSIELSRR